MMYRYGFQLQIHQKILEFHFLFINVMFPAFEANVFAFKSLGWSPASLFCIGEHRRSAYELNQHNQLIEEKISFHMIH